jgi:hypothetical protein
MWLSKNAILVLRNVPKVIETGFLRKLVKFWMARWMKKKRKHEWRRERGLIMNCAKGELGVAIWLENRALRKQQSHQISFKALCSRLASKQ